MPLPLPVRQYRPLSTEEVFNLPLYEAPFLIDFRSKSEHAKSSLPFSRSFPLTHASSSLAKDVDTEGLNPRGEERKSNWLWESFLHWLDEELLDNPPDRTNLLVVYNSSGECIGSGLECPQPTRCAPHELLVNLVKGESIPGFERLKTICVIQHGLKAFQECFPYLILHPGRSVSDMIPYPQAVPLFDKQMYIGDRHIAASKKALADLNIKRVINVTKDIPNHFEIQTKEGEKQPEEGVRMVGKVRDSASPPGGHGPKRQASVSHSQSAEVLHNLSDKPKSLSLMYLRGPIDDVESAPLEGVLRMTWPFIKAALEAKERVLVHCSAGRSRSASVVLHALMQAQNISYHRALVLLQQARPQCKPNPGFARVLQKLEQAE